jgi:hypothetical protein
MNKPSKTIFSNKIMFENPDSLNQKELAAKFNSVSNDIEHYENALDFGCKKENLQSLLSDLRLLNGNDGLASK